jgi:hypothetical protein
MQSNDSDNLGYALGFCMLIAVYVALVIVAAVVGTIAGVILTIAAVRAFIRPFQVKGMIYGRLEAFYTLCGGILGFLGGITLYVAIRDNLSDFHPSDFDWLFLTTGYGAGCYAAYFLSEKIQAWERAVTWSTPVIEETSQEEPDHTDRSSFVFAAWDDGEKR